MSVIDLVAEIEKRKVTSSTEVLGRGRVADGLVRLDLEIAGEEFALLLSPAEARRFAAGLVHLADRAEGKEPKG